MLLAFGLLFVGSAVAGASSLEITDIPDQTVEAGDYMSFTVSATGFNDSSQVVYYAAGLPESASFDESTGVFEWTAEVSDSPFGNEYFLQFFAVEGNMTASEDVTIYVTSPDENDDVNHEPIIQPLEPQTVEVGKYLGFMLAADDLDGDAITFSTTEELPAGATLDSVTGFFEWTPTAGQGKTYDIEFMVSDGELSATTTVTVQVKEPIPEPEPPEPDPLKIVPIGPQEVKVNNALQFTVSATGGDGARTFSTTEEPPSGATLNPSTGEFAWTPAANQTGTHNIEFKVSAGELSDTAQVTITVTEPAPEANDPLTIASIGSKSVVVNKALEFKVTATGGNGTLVYSASSLPSGAKFDNATQVFKWTPTSSQAGKYSPVFKVTDGADTKEVTVPITVTAASTGSGGSSSGGTGSSSTGSSSGGSSGAFQPSNEKFENIVYKDFAIKYVLKDVDNVFTFRMDNNSVRSITIVTLLNEGETKAIVEMLKGTSTAVSKAAPGDVYKNVNIWVGDDKFSESKLKKAQVNFRVEKAWLSDNGVDPASVKLLRYSGSWKPLPTSIAGEDETYVSYTAFTPGFSAFAISSVDESDFALNESENMSLSFDGDQGLNGTAPADQERKSSWLILFLLIGIAGVGLTGYMYKEQIRETLSNISNSDGKSYRRSK